VARLFNDTEDVVFFVNKVLWNRDLNRCGYLHHIDEGGDSSTQNIVIAHIEIRNKSFISHDKYIENIESTQTPKLHEINEEVLSSVEGIRWKTQRNFYKTCSVTDNDMVHRENIERVVTFLKTYRGPANDVIHFVREWGKFVSKGRFNYQHDTSFTRSGSGSDQGNSCIELSTIGDCEDFSHFYRRAFVTLFSCGKLIPGVDIASLNTLIEHYTPFVFICRVKLGGQLPFHSTMILMSSSPEHKTISFEVTSPAKSYYIDDKDYKSWHVASYLLLEHMFLVPVTNDSLQKVKLQDLVEKATNY
jgi:hypothetical protein